MVQKAATAPRPRSPMPLSRTRSASLALLGLVAYLNAAVKLDPTLVVTLIALDSKLFRSASGAARRPRAQWQISIRRIESSKVHGLGGGGHHHHVGEFPEQTGSCL